MLVFQKQSALTEEDVDGHCVSLETVKAHFSVWFGCNFIWMPQTSLADHSQCVARSICRSVNHLLSILSEGSGKRQLVNTLVTFEEKNIKLVQEIMTEVEYIYNLKDDSKKVPSKVSIRCNKMIVNGDCLEPVL